MFTLDFSRDASSFTPYRFQWVRCCLDDYEYVIKTFYLQFLVCTGWHKKFAQFFVRLNFIKYQPIFKIISLSESGENV